MSIDKYELAKAYAETIYGPANGWGQHVHPRYGISHAIMRRLYAIAGEQEATRLLDIEMAAQREKEQR